MGRGGVGGDGFGLWDTRFSQILQEICKCYFDFGMILGEQLQDKLSGKQTVH